MGMSATTPATTRTVHRGNAWNRRTRAAARVGSTMLDVLLAVLLLGLMAIGLARGVGAMDQASGATRRRTQGLSVTRAAAERLRAAGPWAAGQIGPGQQVNEADELDASTTTGLYTEAASVQVLCSGGRDIGDNAYAEVGSLRTKPFASCGNGQRPVEVLTVRTVFNDRATNSATGGVVQYPFALGMRGRDSIAWVRP